MALLIISLWFIRAVKSGLFWLYLLQLKEYRINRLKDYFYTENGKRTLFDKINIIKIIILAFSTWIREFIAPVAILLFAAESAVFLKNIYTKNIKKPVITPGSSPLVILFLSILAVFGLTVFYFTKDVATLSIYLIAFDVCLPIILLFVILMLRPLNRFLQQKRISEAAAKIAKMPNLLVIGITGSYGKTSTKEFLYEMLKGKFRVIKTPEHVNSVIGVANFVLKNLNSKYEIFICEMAAYEKGEIKEIASMVKPRVGIFLGANEQHLSLFGTMENLLKAEGGEELLESLPKGGLGIFNGNNRYAYELYKKAGIKKRIIYAPTLNEIINPEKRDVRAENIRAEKDHVSFKVLTTKNSAGAEFRVNLLGTQNVENVLLCVATAEELGITLKEASDAAKHLGPLERTMKLSKNKDGLNIIDSTYSSNPNGVYAHLEYLKVWDKSSQPSLKLRRPRKVIIMPCLIELGPASKKVHHEIGKLIAESCDLAIITTKDRFKDMQDGAKDGAEEGQWKNEIDKRLFYIEKAEDIINKVKSETGKGDVVLLEGRLAQEVIDRLK